MKTPSKKKEDKEVELENMEQEDKTIFVPEICEEQELCPEAFEVLMELPEDKRNIILRQISIKESSFSGPIPSPEVIKGYDSIVPGAADRVIIMAEKQQEHRMDMEMKIVTSEISLSKSGQIIGFTLVLFFGTIALLLGLYGHDWLAGVVFTTTIIGVGIIFVLRKRPDSKNKEDSDTEE